MDAGQFFWVAESELNINYNLVNTQCPVCEKRIEVWRAGVTFIPKVPIATSIPNNHVSQTEPKSNNNSNAMQVDASSQDKKDKQPKPVDLCCICEERTPDTRVQPCGHVVVCQECSIDLQQTADSDHCVVCRRPITKIEIVS